MSPRSTIDPNVRHDPAGPPRTVGLAAHDLSRFVGRRVFASIDGDRRRCRIVAVGTSGLSLTTGDGRGRLVRPDEVSGLDLRAQA